VRNPVELQPGDLDGGSQAGLLTQKKAVPKELADIQPVT
jgi:hypothetical protein